MNRTVQYYEARIAKLSQNYTENKRLIAKLERQKRAVAEKEKK